MQAMGDLLLAYFYWSNIDYLIENKNLMVLSKSLCRSDILDLIGETVPVGSPDPTNSTTLRKLSALTNELIDSSDRRSLSIDPFADVYSRQIELDRSQINSVLKDKVILITGGQGFIGTNLIAKLKQFEVKRIISVDISTDRSQRVAIDLTGTNDDISVTYYHSDIRDSRSPGQSAGASLEDIFELERPQIVFHLAAERLPGLAEIQIHQTISTNILGCDRVIRLCEEYQVEACIFASTGKASRYFTPDIYAASKKISEWLFSDNSQPRTCQYGIVRFTHVVENSPVSADLDLRVANGLVSLHAPDRYIYTQNVEESVNLLLNALTIIEPGQTKLLAVRDIGWPINTTDLALHKILLSGQNIPIYFKGLPAGYERHVFLGQLDLSGDREVFPMLNVLEADWSEISQSGDMVISAITPFDSAVLHQAIVRIEQAIISGDAMIKQTVIDSEKEIVLSSFLRADSAKLLDILRWGVNSKEMAAAGVDISYYQETIELLIMGMRIPKVRQEIPVANAIESSFPAIVPNLLQPIAAASGKLFEERRSSDLSQPIKISSRVHKTRFKFKHKKALDSIVSGDTG
jgi:Polysaccharide biosynthesis protein